MFKDKFFEALRQSKNSETGDNKTIKTLNKIQRRKRLSSEEFLKVYDTLWKEGPPVKYESPDAWRNLRDHSNAPEPILENRKFENRIRSP
jgi:hypothetical protein